MADVIKFVVRKGDGGEGEASVGEEEREREGGRKGRGRRGTRVRFKLHKGQCAIRDRGIGIHLRSLAFSPGNEGK